MTDFFPGFLDGEGEPTVAVLQDAPPANAAVPEPERPRRDYGAAWRLRVQVFECSLPRTRRAEVKLRARFYTMPWLRRADEFDPDDQLP